MYEQLRDQLEGPVRVSLEDLRVRLSLEDLRATLVELEGRQTSRITPIDWVDQQVKAARNGMLLLCGTAVVVTDAGPVIECGCGRDDCPYPL